MFESALIWMGLKTAAPAIGSMAWFSAIAATATGKTILTALGLYGTSIGVQKYRFEKKVNRSEVVKAIKAAHEESIKEAKGDVKMAQSILEEKMKTLEKALKDEKDDLIDAKAKEREALKAAGEGVKYFHLWKSKSKKSISDEAPKEAPKETPATEAA